MRRVKSNFRYKRPLDEDLIDYQRYMQDEGEVPWRLGGGTKVNSMLDTFSQGGSVQNAARRLAFGGSADPEPRPGFERRAGLLPGLELTANEPYELNGVKGRMKTFDSPWAKHFGDPAGRPPVISPAETFTRGQYDNWKESYRDGSDPFPEQFMGHEARYADMRRSFSNPNIQSSTTGEVDFRHMPNGAGLGQWQGVFRNTAFFADPGPAPSHLDEVQFKIKQPVAKFSAPRKRPIVASDGNYPRQDPFRHYPDHHRRRMGYKAQGGNMATDYDQPTGILGHAAMGGKLSKKKYGLC